jgi:hypothetical protein
VRLADQFAPVEEHDDDFISEEVEPNDGPPSNATDLQVNTTRLVPDGSDLGSPLIDSSANQGIGRDDNLFIRTAIQNKVKTADPFNISHLLSDQQWNGKNGEIANYCPSLFTQPPLLFHRLLMVTTIPFPLIHHLVMVTTTTIPLPLNQRNLSYGRHSHGETKELNLS